MTINDAMKALAEALCERIPEDFRYAPDGIKSSDGLWIWRIDPELAKARNPHRADGMTHVISDPRPNGRWYAVDFLHSEDASARIRRAMPACRLEYLPSEQMWCCWFDWLNSFRMTPDVEHLDDLMAVFLCALYWKGIERPEGL